MDVLAWKMVEVIVDSDGDNESSPARDDNRRLAVLAICNGDIGQAIGRLASIVTERDELTTMNVATPMPEFCPEDLSTEVLLAELERRVYLARSVEVGELRQDREQRRGRIVSDGDIQTRMSTPSGHQPQVKGRMD